MDLNQTTASLENATAVFDSTSWTTTQLKSVVNLTQYAPSAKDLLLAGPRMGMKIGSYIFRLPSVIDDVVGARLGQRVIPEATAIGGAEAITTATAIMEDMAQAGTRMMKNATHPAPGLASKISLESGRSFGNMVAYATSRWSLGCFLMAVIVNRTQVYASTRRPLTLGFRTRFALRIIPIILFAMQAQWLLQSIQCQTSPDFAMLRWGNATRSSELMFTQNGGPLHTLSSVLLLGASDADSCRAVRMVAPEQKNVDAGSSGTPPKLRGSLALLWPLFQTLSFSQFMETLSCAVQGRHVASETGMTLFEHSLAFAEADAAISSSLGWGPFGGAPSAQNLDIHAKGLADNISGGPGASSKLAEIAITRSMILQKINTPPEVLLIGFLSCMSHTTSHILGIFNLQSRLRLINTAFWGLSFMLAITWSVLNFSIDDASNQSLLRFPTVCIIGFIPHVLIVMGIFICAIIYGLAVLLSALAPPPSLRAQRGSFLHNLATAHENMQASVPLSNIRISMHMDFYSALLKTGFSVLTMASEAVYLNESLEVNIKQQTWLEDERLMEIEEVGAQWLGPNFRQGTSDGAGLLLSKDQSPVSSGYSRERVAQDAGKVRSTDKVIRDGVGATERSGRWIMAFELLFGIFKLIISWFAIATLKILTRFGIRARPHWLLWLVKKKTNSQKRTAKRGEQNSETLDFWLLNKEGELVLPPDDHVDVESEMRRRLKVDNPRWSAQDEQQLDTNLYSWWLGGGWWGGDDNSGQFTPRDSELEDDTTSMISMSDVSTDNEWDSESDNDGQRTPTQSSPFSHRETTPIADTPLSSAELAQLLHPQTPEQRAEARALAAHLSSDTIMTRSRYQDLCQREKRKVLTSTRQRPQHLRDATKLSPEEEEELLEYLIVSRRSFGAATGSTSEPHSWAEGASGLGEGGPTCVVCQSAPRSIIVWPCRCLSLCDDCRVTLAMNNFDKCVCCRRDVGSFSRIFVP